MTNRRVLQLRLIVEAEDYEEAVRFYRDVLGLTEQAAFEGEGEARVAILEAGRATLEIANPAQKRMIDDIEVTDLVAAGATLVAAPTETPWRSLNSRLDAPAGLQITLFQELESLEERARRLGFGTDASGHQ